MPGTPRLARNLEVLSARVRDVSDSDSRPTREFVGVVEKPASSGSRPTVLDSGGDAPTFVPPPASGVAPVAEPEGPDPLIGQRVGDYVILEQVGIGGMGVVYAGMQPLIGKPVAIKVLRPEMARDPAQAERLFFEARAVAQIRHRGIIDIFTLGQLPDGRHYFVMEMLKGESLHELLVRRRSLSPTEALLILDEVLSALGAAHDAGLIHRDLKPSNVFLVTQSDGATFAKLLDFGLAKQSSSASGVTPQTRTDVFVGTPEYIAPEQARGGAVAPTTDIYSAGVLLFELLTGRLPFIASSPIDLVVQHLETPAPLPSAFIRGIPPALDELVRRMLAKVPEDRPSSAEEVRAEISRILRVLSDQQDVGADTVVTGPRTFGAYVLKLGTRFELGLSWITPALAALEARRPERNIHLAFGDSADLVRQLRDAQLDCAVTSARLKAEWIRRVELHDETYAFVVAPSLFREGLLSDAADARTLSLIDVHVDLPLFRYFSEAFTASAQWQFRRIEVLGTIAAVRYRVLQGAGVAVLPSYFIREELERGALVRLFPEVELQRDCFRLIWREGHPREKEIELLGAELREIPLR